MYKRKNESGCGNNFIADKIHGCHTNFCSHTHTQTHTQCASAFSGRGQWVRFVYIFVTVSLLSSLSLLHFGRKFSHNHNSNINSNVCVCVLRFMRCPFMNPISFGQTLFYIFWGGNGSRQMRKWTLATERNEWKVDPQTTLIWHWWHEWICQKGIYLVLFLYAHIFPCVCACNMNT